MPPTYHRRVIRIRATDSPNVKLALAQIEAGLEPTHETVVPGVLSWREYQNRRANWDKVKQCVSLDAEFYEGSELLLFPPDWLTLAEERALALPRARKAKGGGCDPAEGGDRTSMAAVDEFGLIEQVSKKTPDTSMIGQEAIAFMRKHDIPPDKFVFDRGGGGKQHADMLRRMGFNVRSVGFGEGLAPDPRYGKAPVRIRREDKEGRYEYLNRRAQMYGELSEALDPGLPGVRFAIPAEYTELRRQLAPMPKLYDKEGRLFMLPKNKRNPDPTNPSTEKTLVELIGCSPDEADSLVLACHGMWHRSTNLVVGAM